MRAVKKTQVRAGGASGGAVQVREPKTGITFEGASAGGLVCVGAGVREKKVAIVSVSVYAVALYVDAAGCRGVRDDAGGGARGAAEAVRAEAAYEREVVIELARQVEASAFAQALVDAVDPRLREMATNQATKENDEGNFMSAVAEAAEKREEAALDDLDALRALVCSGGKDLPKGTRVALTFGAPEGPRPGVAVALGGGQRPATTTTYLGSRELAVALLDVYTGDQCVSPTAKAAFLAGIAAL